jgi:hypothetical protein
VLSVRRSPAKALLQPLEGWNENVIGEWINQGTNDDAEQPCDASTDEPGEE